MKKYLSSVFILFFVISTSVLAGEYSFFGKTDKNPLDYKPGEKMTFSIQLLEDGKPADGKTLIWTCEGDDGKRTTGEAISSSKAPLVITSSIDKPGFVHVFVRVKDLQKSGDSVKFNGGAGVELDKIQGFKEPSDFDQFWKDQKARLAKVPLKANVTVVPGRENYVVKDVKVDCVGKSVSGYLTMPSKAKAKSLPAYVSFHGYGVSSSWPHFGNAIMFDVNAHGIENGKPKEFYEDLKKNELKGYGFSKESNSNRETCYWNGMLLRVIRALEYVKSLPEWDGKTLIVSGGSQGGFQCLCAAGLDSDVSECNAVVPWFADLSGSAESKRLPATFRPAWTSALGYYDTANHAKRIKCKTTISSGLGDYVCPPSSQMVIYNNIKAPVKLDFHQGRTHGYMMPNGAVFSLSK